MKTQATVSETQMRCVNSPRDFLFAIVLTGSVSALPSLYLFSFFGFSDYLSKKGMLSTDISHFPNPWISGIAEISETASKLRAIIHEDMTVLWNRSSGLLRTSPFLQAVSHYPKDRPGAVRPL